MGRYFHPQDKNSQHFSSPISPAAGPRLVSALLLHTAGFPQCLVPKSVHVPEPAAMVCPANLCYEQRFVQGIRNTKVPPQREEPDDRERDHSCGQHVPSTSLDDQTEWLCDHLMQIQTLTQSSLGLHIRGLWTWAMPTIKPVFGTEEWETTERQSWVNVYSNNV